MKKSLLILLFITINTCVIAQQWSLNFIAPAQQDIKVLSAPSDDICWFITNRDSLYKTDNGGSTWTRIPPTSSASFNPSGLFVVDNNLAFKASTSALFKTNDGGVSWSLVFSGGQSQTPVVRMKDQLEGVMTSGGHLYKTIDGGDTWSTAGITQPSDNIQNSSGKGSLYHINNQLWATIQNSGVAYSHDFGITWSMPANTGLSFSGLPRIGFGNSSLGMALKGAFPYIYLTTNGGTTWTIADNSLGANQDVVVNGTQCWYIPNPADHFYVKYSKDSGATWLQQLVDAAGFDVLEKAGTGNRLWAGTTQGKLYTYFDSLTLLPLNDMGITVHKSGNCIKIGWIDENFLYTNVYEVERSTDGILFTNLTRQNAHSGIYYSFLDGSPKQGNNFYRVIKRTKTRTVEYSEIVRFIWRENKGNIKLGYPIMNGKCRLFFESMPPATYLVKLLTSDGRILAEDRIVHTNNTIEKTVTGNTKGFFILKITGPNNNNINIPVILL